MSNQNVTSNPNDNKVVSFHNKESYGFTPDMGCMYDSRAINGKNGSPGIDAGETVILPYHVAQQLALNLAKVAITKSAPQVDPAGIPTGVALWDEPKLMALKDSYITELYVEEKPVQQSETDKLMAKVEEYRQLVEKLVPGATEPTSEPVSTEPKTTFADKADVITELEVRGIVHDKRKSKDELEKLLA